MNENIKKSYKKHYAKYYVCKAIDTYINVKLEVIAVNF